MEPTSTRNWLTQGHTQSELRTAITAGTLEVPRRGMVIPADQPPRDRQLLLIRSAMHFLGPDTVISHTSAAALHGLPLLQRRCATLVVVRPLSSHGNITSTLHARRAGLEPHEITGVEGIPTTSLLRTVGDLVRELPFLEAVMVADAGLARGLTREDLRATTRLGRGCRRSAAVIAFADPRSESPGESVSRVRIWQAGLPAPALQHHILDPEGNFLGRGDFWWEFARLVGEFDGAVKYTDLIPAGQSVADVLRAERQRELSMIEAGYRVVRWTWSDLWSPDFITRLRRALYRTEG